MLQGREDGEDGPGRNDPYCKESQDFNFHEIVETPISRMGKCDIFRTVLCYFLVLFLVFLVPHVTIPCSLPI